MQQISTIAAVRRFITRCRPRPVVLVPTMGNLHAGHLALVERAKQIAGGCVVTTIFVNPTQFAAGEDYTAYPRTLNADLKILVDSGVDLVFTPEESEMYAAGLSESTQVTVPLLENKYCGAFRPGHFAGVAAVVAKLFNIVLPDHAVFGEKDYQQLVIIKKLVTDLFFPITIIGVPTVREQDGLAMSSRNHYLTAEERSKAPLLYKTLAKMAAEIERGNTDYAQLQRTAIASLSEQDFTIEYIHVCDAQTLNQPQGGNRVILAAAWLGRARLIDNIAVQR